MDSVPNRAPSNLQGPPVKRRLSSRSPLDNSDLVDAVKCLSSDKQLPLHVKTILTHLLNKSTAMEDLVQQNRKLEENFREQTLDNEGLRKEIDVLRLSLCKNGNNPQLTTQSSPVVENLSTNVQGNCNIVVLNMSAQDLL
ncbi:unnamed protein product [Haemonchus placei]|uniref:Uncharacterized protein n=1 Tax=Haemonchus placei TaxID=6290 RepID=A0A0N4X190_HAEPC|nr:unnamed protein product [Haemonchus placei]